MGSLFSSSDAAKVDERPPDVIYKEADANLDKGDYTKAAEQFEEVDRQHPYSRKRKSHADGRLRLQTRWQAA